MVEDIKTLEKTELPTEPVFKNKKTSHMQVIIIHILVVIGFGVASYFIYDKFSEYKAAISSKDAQIVLLQKSMKNLQASQGDSTTVIQAPLSVQPSDLTVTTIKSAISIGNTQPLEGYMASSVNVILDATEAYGFRTPIQAELDITSFIGDPTTTTWDFELDNATLLSLRNGGSAQYFPEGAIIGKSNTGKTISISFDSNGKINTVFLSNTI